MKIAVIAHAHHPIKQPFAGGLEAHTHQLIAELVRQGHYVTLFAKAGSQTAAELVSVFRGDAWDGENPFYNRAYRYTMRRIASGNYDIIINNSLNHTPLALHTAAMPPMITIFHTPPLPKMVAVLDEQSLVINRTYITVSEFTAQQWRPHCSNDVHVVSNGMDLRHWKFNSVQPTPKQAVWVGRITREKGTHVAIKACLSAGIPITISGNIANKSYFESEVEPLLTNPLVRYAGHGTHAELNRLYASASVALVTPVWDEPFGLVAIEALASGTPVAALPNGALPDIIIDEVGSVAVSESVEDLQVAIQSAINKDRQTCRDYVQRDFTLQKMVRSYLALVPECTVLDTNGVSWQPAV